MRRATSSVNRSRRPRAALGVAATAAIVAALVPTLSWAHAVVFPRQSTTGSYEKYVLRVPNEKAVATTRVEIHFPAGLRVTSFADVPGWQLEVVTDSAKAITAAIWTGNLPPQRFAEFPFVAANPKTDTQSSSGRPIRPTLMVSGSSGLGLKAPSARHRSRRSALRSPRRPTAAGSFAGSRGWRWSCRS